MDLQSFYSRRRPLFFCKLYLLQQQQIAQFSFMVSKFQYSAYLLGVVFALAAHESSKNHLVG